MKNKKKSTNDETSFNPVFWRLAQFLLIFHGVVTLTYAGTVLTDTAGLAEYMGLSIVNGDGTAELITMYVGSSGATAMFFVFTAFRRQWLLIGLLFLVITMTGITAVRTISWMALETGSYTQNAVLYYDVPLTILAWFTYRRLTRVDSE